VIAEFYARIFFRNSVNGGYLVPLESVHRWSTRSTPGDELEVHMLDGYVLNKTKNQRHELRPLGDVLPIIEAAGCSTTQAADDQVSSAPRAEVHAAPITGHAPAPAIEPFGCGDARDTAC
jgi:3-isopropylmalate dehydratase small subunit